MAKIVDVFSSRLQIESPEQFATVLANKIVQNMSDLQAPTTQLDFYGNAHWKETDTQLICLDCFHYASRCKDTTLRTFLRSNFGYISRQQQKIHIKSIIKNHTSNALHAWCYNKTEQVAAQSKRGREVNEKAANMLITNAILYLQTSESAATFLKYCNKDVLNEDLSKYVARKNDGMQMFFELRKLIYDELFVECKQLFENVCNISVTLDKVTCAGVPYTVIFTYFFYEGRIHCFFK